MAGLSILCPKCKSPMNVRTSERPTDNTVVAEVRCVSCSGVKAKFMGELTEIQYASFSPIDPDKKDVTPKPKKSKKIDLGYFV